MVTQDTNRALQVVLILLVDKCTSSILPGDSPDFNEIFSFRKKLSKSVFYTFFNIGLYYWIVSMQKELFGTHYAIA
jgi:hypothetical protein